MKVIVEVEKCVASGQCVVSAPDVFDQREEDGMVVLLAETPADAVVDDVQDAIMLCPARAIRLEG